MNPVLQATFDLVGLVIFLAFRLAVFAGCAYFVFWRDASPWWFLLAAVIAFSVTAKINLGAAP